MSVYPTEAFRLPAIPDAKIANTQDIGIKQGNGGRIQVV
jgi:hypothetical protein